MTLEPCREACVDTAKRCWETLSHCLARGGEHAKQSHVIVLIDCAEICAATASFIARQSPFQFRAIALCAEICARCAGECDRLGDDDLLRRCGETCRRCLDECRRVSS